MVLFVLLWWGDVFGSGGLWKSFVAFSTQIFFFFASSISSGSGIETYMTGMVCFLSFSGYLSLRVLIFSVSSWIILAPPLTDASPIMHVSFDAP